MAELSAQFDADLMDCPDASQLRGYFRHLALRANQIEGLLGKNWAGSHPLQAAAELAALSGISDAYKRISGKYTRTDSLTDKITKELEKKFGHASTVKEYLAPILPLLMGSAAGVATSAAGSGGIVAVGSGVLAALGSAAVVKYTHKHTVEKSRVENFMFDLSVATLDRVIPVLIRRLWDAGLAPIFVVDELDKVKGLHGRMEGIVHHLKKLVSENAFFCFLADREYFEAVLRDGVNQAYPEQYTYYSRRLFTALQAHDFATYLIELFGIRKRVTPPPAQGPVPVSAGSPGATAPPSTPGGATIQAGEVLAATGAASEDNALQRFLWVLRHRSQLHPLDLQRQITAMLGHERYVTLTLGEAASAAYRSDVTIQVLIEALLNEEDVKRRVASKPEDLRLIHDALYFITREWWNGADSVDTADESKFFDYLRKRTGVKAEDEKDPTTPMHSVYRNDKGKQDQKPRRGSKGAKKVAEKTKRDKVVVPAGLPRAADDTFTKHDRTFLFGLVKRLAEALTATSLAEASTAGALIARWEKRVLEVNPSADPPVLPAVKDVMWTGNESVLRIDLVRADNSKVYKLSATTLLAICWQTCNLSTRSQSVCLCGERSHRRTRLAVTRRFPQSRGRLILRS